MLRWRSGWSASGKQRTKAIQKSVKSVAKAVVYVALAVLAIKFALGSGQSSAQQQQQKTAGVFGWPGGRLLVGDRRAGAHRRRRPARASRASNKQLPQADRPRPGPPSARKLITRLGQVGLPRQGRRAGAGRRAARTRRRSPSTRRRPAGWTARCARSWTRPFGRCPADARRARHRRVRRLLLRPCPLPRAHLTGGGARALSAPALRARASAKGEVASDGRALPSMVGRARASEEQLCRGRQG